MDNSTRQRPRRRIALGVAICAAGAALAIPSSAFAIGIVTTSESSLDVSADIGIANRITVTTTPGSVTVTDTADILTSGANPVCTGDGTHTLVCSVPALTNWSAGLSDMDDRLEAIGPFPGLITGSDGNDELIGGISPSNLDGGAGDDDLIGGAGSERLGGGGGDDTIDGGAGNDFATTGEGEGGDTISLGEGNDQLFGTNSGMVVDLGPGNDTYLFDLNFPEAIVTIDGGAGSDSVSGLGFNPPFFGAIIDLAGGTMTAAAPDATPRSLTGFEDVAGTFTGADTITGTPGPNLIVSGASSTARFFAQVFAGVSAPNLAGTVDPGAGADIVDTGASDDQITVADGYIDRVLCGTGTDTVTTDQFDILEDCEQVNLQRTRAAVADLRAPACKLTRAAARSSRKAFLRGYPISFACDEPVAVVGTAFVSARARKKRVVLSEAGDVTLAEQTTQAGAGSVATLTLKPGPRKLARRLPARFGARVVIDARDEFGNRTTLTQRVRVTGPKAKRKPADRKRTRR